MAIPKKGSRKIVVNGEEYRWLIRRKATNHIYYGSALISLAVEFAEHPGKTLVIVTDRKHPKDIMTKVVVPVLPSDVSEWIQMALKLNWKPKESGPQMQVYIKEGVMIKK